MLVAIRTSILVLILFLLPGCASVHSVRIRTLQRQLSLQSTELIQTAIDVDINDKPSGAPPITIWIHGTRLFPRPILRNFFFSPEGLCHYNKLNPQYHLYTIAQTLIKSAPDQFPAATFYIFGWSGKLCFIEREKAAQRLYRELKELIEQYREQYGCLPVINIITHSHGGNVALNLVKVKDEHDDELMINMLVMLATPVQAKTREYIKHTTFNKVYAFYSRLDMLQILDPQGLYRLDCKAGLFSDRCFDPHEKLIQVKLKLNGRALWHTEFILPGFLCFLPAIIIELNSWQTQGITSYNNWYECDKLLSVYTNGKIIRPSRSRKTLILTAKSA